MFLTTLKIIQPPKTNLGYFICTNFLSMSYSSFNMYRKKSIMNNAEIFDLEPGFFPDSAVLSNFRLQRIVTVADLSEAEYY